MTETHARLFDQTLRVLEWDRLLDLAAGLARSSIGAARLRAAEPAPGLSQACLRQEETTEMVALLESQEPFPALAFPDVREALARAGKDAQLDAHELRDCSIVLDVVEDATRYLRRHRAQAPSLASAAGVLLESDDLGFLKRDIDRAIAPDGSMKESATPELTRLTHHAHELKQQMRHRLEQILQSRRYEDVLQEHYFAQREGRYVVPVKADMRGRIPGIVHDISSSGATVFLEPRELVELNNSIKVAELDVEREVRRILRELSALVGRHAGDLEARLAALAELDAIAAKGLFSRRINAHPVRLNDEGRIHLRQARHPLLVLTKDLVVPNDIDFGERTQVLVISGPNTGGKTVTLKIIGLFALMVRYGFHLPCAPESDMAMFPAVYADIGDAQDLARDLSSFSAHMTQMIALLKAAARTPAPGDGERSVEPALLLLDEPVTSTDPAEGAALAEALLCRLAALRMKVVATTHYGPLKALAQTTPGFANASVEFDVATLSPTYRIHMGVPGGSSAIDIAGRLGMDEDILSDARARLRQDDRRMETVLADLQNKQRRLSADAERAAQARREAEQASRKAQDVLARLEERESEERRGIKRRLTEEFSRARAQVQATVDELKREQKLLKAKEAKARLADLERQTVRHIEPPSGSVPIEQLGPGDLVEIAGLGMTGALLEAPQGKKRVRVKVGEGEVLAGVANLVGVGKGPGASRSRGPRPTARESAPVAGREEPTIVDVRGLAADDALDAVVAALDRAALAGAPMLRIIHGHGTGRLKAVLRDYLKDSPYVAAFRAGDRAEGGDGVTIVQVR